MDVLIRPRVPISPRMQMTHVRRRCIRRSDPKRIRHPVTCSSGKPGMCLLDQSFTREIFLAGPSAASPGLLFTVFPGGSRMGSAPL